MLINIKHNPDWLSHFLSKTAKGYSVEITMEVNGVNFEELKSRNAKLII